METFCQDIRFHSIRVEPDISTFSYIDYFGNHTEAFSIPFRHRKMEIVSTSEVSTFTPSLGPLNTPITVREAQDWFQRNYIEFFDYIHPSEFTPLTSKIREFAEYYFTQEKSFVQAIWDLNEAFTKIFKYRSGSTTINTPIEEVLQKKEGVCQDYSHLMIACLRSIGLAARYVSGYVETYSLIGSEQSHAWIDVYIPNESWVGFDPTNNKTSSEQHIRIAMGRDFNDVSPVRGTFNGAGNHSLKVEVSMKRKDETLDNKHLQANAERKF